MDIALNNDGDLDLANADMYFVTGVDSVAQFLKQSLKFFLTEWFLDETKGMPYYDEVFVKNPNPIVISSLFKTKILKTPGVLELLEFSIGLDTEFRSLQVLFSVRTADGIINFNEVIGV